MKFLVGYNGSTAAKSALTLARDFAKVFGAKVFVLVSMEGGSSEKIEEINKARADLEFAKEFLDQENVECEAREMVRGVSPAEDLVQFATDKNIDQIFVGIEKKTRTRKILLGSTAQYVILKAPCPVISVK
ncbi:MAG: universal stress protein [Deltaproteobacteria bacterium]|nr:MAG: universal stress protein [Deltaproteobacteria bacterium]RUA00702.1 MAG: universal stress protein [Deltaproteobacteria bacterium]